MKKIAFTLAGLLVIMLTGCGEGSSTTSPSSPTTQNVNDGTPSATSNPVNARGLTQFPAVPAIPE